MTHFTVLLLPGWQNSGPGHWQSLWEERYGYWRVEQHDWMRPLRGDWCARLDDVLADCDQAVTLVAHSLGCQLVAAWAAHSALTARVRAALLVAPPDTQAAALRPFLPSGWSPIPLQTLPFASIVVSSDDDPYCSPARAELMARAWGARQVHIGERGHINAESGLGLWDQGHALLQSLLQEATV